MSVAQLPDVVVYRRLHDGWTGMIRVGSLYRFVQGHPWDNGPATDSTWAALLGEPGARA